jgi:hypothetical protein
LARGLVTAEARELLGLAAASCEGCLLLVQYVKGKVDGSKGTWNPSNGAITRPMSSLVLQASLISCEDSRVVWKGEAVLRGRELAAARDKTLLKTVDVLFGNFEAR